MLLKVCYVVKIMGLFIIVDDFGLLVKVLNGVFGLYFVCYVGEEGNDEVNC